MHSNEAEVLAHVFASEGGYTNHPADPGGPTNFGITIVDARKYGAEFGWVASPTVADMRAMPKAFAEQVYDAKYWDVLCGDALPSGLDYAVVDYGINSGVSRSAKVLQRLCGIVEDGRIGPVTLAAVAAREASVLIEALNAERLAFLRSLRTWPVFGKGWSARVSAVTTTALHMAARDPAVTTESVVAKVTVATPTAKGVAPPPLIAQRLVTGAGLGLSASPIAYGAWAATHPVAAAVIVAAGIVAIAGGLYVIGRRYWRAQDAPMPGTARIPAQRTN
jgi:lysozyme family protein